MKTIYFHIELPKRGTPFLQTVFAFNAKNYEKHDLIYLDIEKNFDAAIKGKAILGNYFIGLKRPAFLTDLI